MRRAAAESFPREACGLLLGSVREGEVLVDRFLPAANAAPARRRFEIDARTVWGAIRQGRSEGLELVGVFHSHPGAPAEPSAIDAGQEWGGLVWLITACDDGGVGATRAWWRRGEGFRELAIVPAPWAAW